ncbi:unnamed protein product [Brassica oleracea]
MKRWRRKEKAKEKETEKEAVRKCFLKNGSMFLEQLKADCDGMSNPLRMFSSDQISKATNHFDPKCYLPNTSYFNNNGFLKLIGCCLEFPHPVMVFEDVEYKALNIRGSPGSEDVPVLPWNVLLKITKEVATAITYLHTAFPRIIIATNIFLDKNWGRLSSLISPLP